MALQVSENSKFVQSPTSHCPISQLRPFMNANIHITGILIHLTDINTFSSVNPSNQDRSNNLILTDDNRLVLDSEPSTVLKSVFSFVLTDQPMSTIEFKYWGEPESAIKLKDLLRIGAVIKIIRPKIVAKSFTSTSEVFSPITYSQNRLLFTTGTVVTLARSAQHAQLRPLMSIPPSYDYFTLYDVIMGGGEMDKCEVNVLAVVAQIKDPVTSYSEKLAREICRLDIFFCWKFLFTYQHFSPNLLDLGIFNFLCVESVHALLLLN